MRTRLGTTSGLVVSLLVLGTCLLSCDDGILNTSAPEEDTGADADTDTDSDTDTDTDSDSDAEALPPYCQSLLDYLEDPCEASDSTLSRWKLECLDLDEAFDDEFMVDLVECLIVQPCDNLENENPDMLKNPLGICLKETTNDYSLSEKAGQLMDSLCEHFVNCQKFASSQECASNQGMLDYIHFLNVLGDDVLDQVLDCLDPEPECPTPEHDEYDSCVEEILGEIKLDDDVPSPV